MTNPRTPSDLGKRMINMSFAMLAAVGVIVYFIYTGAVKPDEPVTLTVTTEQPEASAAGKPIKVDVTFRLENNTKETQALTAATQCDVFRWFLTDDKREFVQSQAYDKVCAQVTVSTALAARHIMTEKFPIELDPKRVHPGDYRIFVRYWGHETDAAITIR
jgi:hypothetical protein